MHVGILGGTGPAGGALAVRLASLGVDVTIGSRSKDRAADICAEHLATWPGRELRLSGGDNETAAAADLVVVATPWDAAAPTAASVAAGLDGKVVICMANALVRIGKVFEPLIPPRGSVASEVQAAVPGALVAAAYQHLPARELGNIDGPIESDVLICSDHPEAVKATTALTLRIPGLRPLDAGPLASAMAIEAFTAVLLNLNVRYKAHTTLRITGAGMPGSDVTPAAP